MHCFTQNTSGERYTRSPDPTPYGNIRNGALTPHLRRGLDVFSSWSRHLGGL